MASTTAQIAGSTETPMISLELPSMLTGELKKILEFVYDSAKEFASDILNHPTMSNALKITQLIGNMIKLLENLSFGGKKITGSTKKAVAVELGRNLIQDLIKDQELKTTLLGMYDMLADSTLETLIDVSQHVNTAMKEAAASCCEALVECLRKK
jgi:hypothetical protein